MRISERNKRAYERHSAHQTHNDNKHREHFFVIENLDNDYLEMRRVLANYKHLSFDFCASCLYNSPPNLRVYNDNLTGRFPVDKQVSLQALKEQLIADGYTFKTRSSKSGPLCLYDDFSEPFSAKRFRFFLPLWEVFLFLRYQLRSKK